MSSLNLDELVRSVKTAKKAPVDLWSPDFCGDIDMVIHKDGSWSYMGSPIGRDAMVRLFASVLKKEDDKYFLVTPVEKLGIRVEDAPFLAVSLEQITEGKRTALLFTTNVGDRVIAGPDHGIRVAFDPTSGEPRPYVHVRAGLEALITRSIYYELVELAQEQGGQMLVESEGQAFSLGYLEEEAKTQAHDLKDKRPRG